MAEGSMTACRGCIRCMRIGFHTSTLDCMWIITTALPDVRGTPALVPLSRRPVRGTSYHRRHPDSNCGTAILRPES